MLKVESADARLRMKKEEEFKSLSRPDSRKEREQERGGGSSLSLGVAASLALGPLIPAPLADSRLEVRGCGRDVLACAFHGAADFVAVCIHCFR